MQSPEFSILRFPHKKELKRKISEFMNNRVKIKVIKKGEVKISEAPEITESEPEQDNSSNLSSTVSGWINEFQNRRREERESAIEQFQSWE